MGFKVAIVSTDERERLALVKSLESAPAEWIVSLHRQAPDDADVIVCSIDMGIEGAIIVDPCGATDVLHEVRRVIVARPKVISVTSIEGGTGTTTVALHLAAALASLGVTTTFVDLDPGRGAHHRLGLQPSDEVGALRPVPVAGGFRFLADAADSSVPDDLPDDTQQVVLDVRPESLDRLAGCIDVSLILVRPTPAGMQRARAIIEAHESVAWCPVLNRVGRGGQTTMSQVERALGGRVIELPVCPGLRDVEEEQRLLSPGWSRWYRKLHRLAGSLVG